MKKFIPIIIIFILIFISCEENNNLTDLTNQSEFSESFLDNCFLGIGVSRPDEMIILDEISYLEFEDNMRSDLGNIDCDNAKLPSIDFDKFSLLCKSTLGSGCSANFDRKILRDDKNKKIIYEITVEYVGLCDMLIGNWNWAIVPKIPEDYSIEFKIE